MQPGLTHGSAAATSVCVVWTLDPSNSGDLIAHLRPHALAEDFQVAWVGEGWRALVHGCHRELSATFPAYGFYAIKQKFGLLEYQARARRGPETEAEWKQVQAITDAYRARSASVCEWCGGTGKTREQRDLILTLCDTCDGAFSDPPGQA